MKRKRGWISFKVDHIETETHDCKTLYLVDADDNDCPFDYLAGQYITMRFDDLQDKPVARSYTMSSSPCSSLDNNNIAVTVKKIPDGLVSSYLVDQVKEGDIIRARGPIGKFCYGQEADTPHLGIVAAGSGVTPFVSIMREMLNNSEFTFPWESITLLVSFRNDSEIICQKELEEFASHPKVHIHYTFTRQEVKGSFHGRINHSMLDQCFLEGIENRTIMTCGPDEMMEDAKTHLIKQGLPAAQFKMESFAS